MSNNAKYRGTLLFVLWFVMAGATWGVGLTAFRPDEGGSNAFYLTLAMLTVVELLVCLYFIWMGDGTVTRRNMPLQFGGGVMLALYCAAVLVLTFLSGTEIEFRWLLLGHVIALAALFVGWSIVRVAVNHAKAQDKKGRKRPAPFIAMRNRYAHICDQIEANPDAVMAEARKKALHLRDEVFRYARIDTSPGMEAADREVDNELTTLESVLNRMAGVQITNAADTVTSSLEALERAMQRREKRPANTR